jgi:Cu2+-exporting ATPase
VKTWAADHCAHCRLPLGGAPVESDEPAFCCLGCRLASTMSGGRDGPLQFLEARLILAACLAMGVMTFSLVLYSEDLHALGDEQGLATMRELGRLLIALFALPVAALLAPPLAAGAWADLRRGVVAMDGLVVLAVLAAFGLSLHATWVGEGEVWFETATMVLVLVTFGRRLEAHARSEGRDASRLLDEWLPPLAHRVGSDGTEVDVAPDGLVRGDRVRVAPGESVPADGRVEDGTSEVVTAHLTGEPTARAVGPGDTLSAGSANGHGALTLRVEAPLSEGSLGRLVALLDSPVESTRAMRTADRWAGWLTLLALTLAVVGGVASWREAGAGAGLRTALAVLLVACPCALGLATPLAYRALRTALARRGVLVADAAQLERVATVDLVLFDKTGTLTELTGRPRELWARPGAVDRLGALVRASGHALGRAFEEGASAPPLSDVQLVPGRGVTGRLDGQPARAGALAWLLAEGASLPPALGAEPPAGAVALEESGELTAVVSFEQALRPEATAAVADLHALGCQVEVVTGDPGRTAAEVARALDVTVHDGLAPEDKLAHARAARARGLVVLGVGDGLNDAPVLREADVSAAMAGGTRAAQLVSGIQLARDDLSALPILVRAGRRLRATVRGNLIWTVSYNAVALGLAATGNLHPIAAAVVMIASSLVVSLRCHRLLTWRDEHGPAAVPGAAAARPALAAEGAP